jgi:hypothetical protein
MHHTRSSVSPIWSFIPVNFVEIFKHVSNDLSAGRLYPFRKEIAGCPERAYGPRAFLIEEARAIGMRAVKILQDLHMQ